MTTAHAIADPPPASTGLGALIYAQRKRAGLTQRELAERAGMSVSAIKYAEGGRRVPNPAHLRAIGRALGVRFVDDGEGDYRMIDPEPDPPMEVPPPRVVVVVVSTAEAVEAALDRLGVPRQE